MFHDAFGPPRDDSPGARPLVFVAFFLALLVACLWGGKAHAHDAYDYRCCGERDCAAVPDSWVHETGDVIIFRIPPGGHPMYGAENTRPLIVEFDRFRLEQRRMDGRWHICLNPAHFPLCVYPPDRGM